MDDIRVWHGSSSGDVRSFGAWVVVVELEEYRHTRIHPRKSRETARNADRKVNGSGRDVSFGIIVTTGRNKVFVTPADIVPCRGRRTPIWNAVEIVHRSAVHP